VKKYVELTLRKVVTKYVTAVVDTDLEGADLEAASYTPEQFKDAANPWREWLRDYRGDDPDATEYELDAVRLMLDCERDANDYEVPFVVEKAPEDE
jgi:hypothetical protein